MAVRFCGGERTAEGLPCPLTEKKEGEEVTKSFPWAPRFCLAEKATFTGASPFPCSYHLPILCHSERGHFGEGRVKAVEPQR